MEKRIIRLDNSSKVPLLGCHRNFGADVAFVFGIDGLCTATPLSTVKL